MEFVTLLGPRMLKWLLHFLEKFSNTWSTDTDRREQKYSEKSLSHCRLVRHKSHMDWPGIERGQRPAEPRQSLELMRNYVSAAMMIYVLFWVTVITPCFCLGDENCHFGDTAIQSWRQIRCVLQQFWYIYTKLEGVITRKTTAESYIFFIKFYQAKIYPLNLTSAHNSSQRFLIKLTTRTINSLKTKRICFI
jgi:hypothetical protein